MHLWFWLPRLLQEQHGEKFLRYPPHPCSPPLLIPLPRAAAPPTHAMQFGIKETELLGGASWLMKDGVVDERWQAFMKFQIARARKLFEDAEAGVDLLDAKARWPVWSALILYRQVRKQRQHRHGPSFVLCVRRVVRGQSLLRAASCASLRSRSFPPPSLPHTCLPPHHTDPGCDRGQRLQQLHKARVRPQVAQAGQPSRRLCQGVAAAAQPRVQGRHGCRCHLQPAVMPVGLGWASLVQADSSSRPGVRSTTKQAAEPLIAGPD